MMLIKLFCRSIADLIMRNVAMNQMRNKIPMKSNKFIS
jgi:hypothetical protein